MGGASCYIAVKAVMRDGKKVVFRLLRSNIKQECEYGFLLLERAIAICDDANVQEISADLSAIITDAKLSTQMEIDHEIAGRQYEIAKDIYTDKRSHVVRMGSNKYEITMQPVTLYDIGEQYQMISYAPGTEFNVLKASERGNNQDPRNMVEPDIAGLTAYLICLKEVTNMLGDGPFNPDQHGGQVRVHYTCRGNNHYQVLINCYDFGEMRVTPWTRPQIEHCRIFFKCFIKQISSDNKNLDANIFKKTLVDMITSYLRTNAGNEDDLARLRSVRKSMLALTDYFEVLAENKVLLKHFIKKILHHCYQLGYMTTMLGVAYISHTQVKRVTSVLKFKSLSSATFFKLKRNVTSDDARCKKTDSQSKPLAIVTANQGQQPDIVTHPSDDILKSLESYLETCEESGLRL